MKRSAVGLAALLLVAAPARAEEKPTLSAEARAGLMLLGGARPTGGLALGAGARYLHPFGAGPWGVYGGLGAAAVGVGDSWHWLGLLAAPEAGAWWASGPWHLSAGLGLPMGQIPTCTDWGLCLRSWGAFPEIAMRGAVRTESLRIGLEVSALWVETLPWSGAGGQVRIVGAYR
jgi:hypothetical protein